MGPSCTSKESTLALLGGSPPARAKEACFLLGVQVEIPEKPPSLPSWSLRIRVCRRLGSLAGAAPSSRLTQLGEAPDILDQYSAWQGLLFSCEILLGLVHGGHMTKRAAFPLRGRYPFAKKGVCYTDFLRVLAVTGYRFLDNGLGWQWASSFAA